MNYSKIISYDICNGPGWRVTLYVSGCSRKCPGCFNPQTHDPCFGREFTKDTVDRILYELSNDKISGLSLLGGDPMFPSNRKQVIDLCKICKEKYPYKSIWMWTGYLMSELIEDNTSNQIFRYVDTIIDGPFKQELKDPNLKWKGSSNQIVWKIFQSEKPSDYIDTYTIIPEYDKQLGSNNAIQCQFISYLKQDPQYVRLDFKAI